MSSQGRHFIKNVRGQAIVSGAQRNRIRLPNLEQAMEYEDSSVDVHRYPGHVKADEPKGYEPVLIIKQNRDKPLVVVDCVYFFDLLRRVSDE